MGRACYLSDVVFLRLMERVCCFFEVFFLG